MNPYLGELVGTFLLVLLGCGVNANVTLPRTKGHRGGWMVITLGWGMAVFVAVWCVADVSGAHLNPAVSLGIAAAGVGEFGWKTVPGYMAAQMLGAVLGAAVVYFLHQDHFKLSEDPAEKLGVFSTSPGVRNLPLNALCEAVATGVLVLAVLLAADPAINWAPMTDQETPIGLGTLGALPVGLLVLAIGLCLGGPTGYAINPARDLGPRITHALLPIPGKGPSDWSYSWVPVLGPCVGGVVAAVLYNTLW